MASGRSFVVLSLILGIQVDRFTASLSFSNKLFPFSFSIKKQFTDSHRSETINNTKMGMQLSLC